MADNEIANLQKSSSAGLPCRSQLLQDIRKLITETRTEVAVAVNAGLTILYWRVGNRIHKDILSEKRADYGKEIVATLSRQLVAEYGKGFAETNLRRMIQFAEIFPEEKIVVTLSRQLSWSHFLALIPFEKAATRVLRGNVLDREVERPNPAAKNRRYAL